MQQLKIKRFREDARLPTRAHETDAGLDFYAPEDILLRRGKVVKISSGFGIALEPGYVGLFFDRSSIGSTGVKVFGGVIDANYRGEIKIMLSNIINGRIVIIEKGSKIAQLIITKAYTPELLEVEDFEVTDRNDNGFGSTGE